MGEYGDKVPRCHLWGPLNPWAPHEDWDLVRCDRPHGHRGLCRAQRPRGDSQFAGQPKP